MKNFFVRLLAKNKIEPTGSLAIVQDLRNKNSEAERGSGKRKFPPFLTTALYVLAPFRPMFSPFVDFMRMAE